MMMLKELGTELISMFVGEKRLTISVLASSPWPDRWSILSVSTRFSAALSCSSAV